MCVSLNLNDNDPLLFIQFIMLLSNNNFVAHVSHEFSRDKILCFMSTHIIHTMNEWMDAEKNEPCQFFLDEFISCYV